MTSHFQQCSLRPTQLVFFFFLFICRFAVLPIPILEWWPMRWLTRTPTDSCPLKWGSSGRSLACPSEEETFVRAAASTVIGESKECFNNITHVLTPHVPLTHARTHAHIHPPLSLTLSRIHTLSYRGLFLSYALTRYCLFPCVPILYTFFVCPCYQSTPSLQTARPLSTHFSLSPSYANYTTMCV